MEPTDELIDAIYIEKVMHMPAACCLNKTPRLGVARLFEYAREIAMSGIRHQNPGASPERIRELFRQRLKIRLGNWMKFPFLRSEIDYLVAPCRKAGA